MSSARPGGKKTNQRGQKNRVALAGCFIPPEPKSNVFFNRGFFSGSNVFFYPTACLGLARALLRIVCEAGHKTPASAATRVFFAGRSYPIGYLFTFRGRGRTIIQRPTYLIRRSPGVEGADRTQHGKAA